MQTTTETTASSRFSTGAVLLRTVLPPLPTLLSRLQAGFRSAFCNGGPVFAEKGFATRDLVAARSGDIYALDCQPALFWHCGKSLNDCAGCPRFQAYRQGLATGKQGLPQLHMALAPDAVKPDVGDGHIEPTQVADIDADGRRTTDANGRRNIHPNPQPVVHPVAPGIQDAKHGSQHSNGESDCLYQTRINTHSVTPGENAIVGQQQGGAA